jgi:hypothetical protein
VIWQLLAIVIGLGVMAAPDLLALGDAVADAFHVLGPIGVAVGAMAASSVLRELRRLHLLLGPAIAGSALLLGGSPAAIAVGFGAGAMLVILAFPGGADPAPLGGGWRALWAGDVSTSGPPRRADRT